MAQLEKRPHSAYVDRKVESGVWKLERIPARVLGLARALEVYRATRKSDLITHGWFGDNSTFCPPLWWDLAIGSGACGLGCRACFLMLTFRTMRDPSRHVLYSNVEDFRDATARWLLSKQRQSFHTLGLGIDRSDSLLYEGVVGHARELIPMFMDPGRNPRGCYLILLTKSTNVHYLPPARVRNGPVAITFSLNPECIADLWEGKDSLTGERITPSIASRLESSIEAQRMGYEVRWRVDPIFTPIGWEDAYEAFFAEAARIGARPHFVTLGTYREKNHQLDYWRRYWGLPKMEWTPAQLEQSGTHFHVEERGRKVVYETIRRMIERHLPESFVALCRETYRVRRATGLCGSECVCLKGSPRSTASLVQLEQRQ